MNRRRSLQSILGFNGKAELTALCGGRAASEVDKTMWSQSSATLGISPAPPASEDGQAFIVSGEFRDRFPR